MFPNERQKHPGPQVDRLLGWEFEMPPDTGIPIDQTIYIPSSNIFLNATAWNTICIYIYTFFVFASQLYPDKALFPQNPTLVAPALLKTVFHDPCEKRCIFMRLPSLHHFARLKSPASSKFTSTEGQENP